MPAAVPPTADILVGPMTSRPLPDYSVDLVIDRRGPLWCATWTTCGG